MKFTLYSALAALTTSTLAAPLFTRQANATSSVNGTTSANSTSSGADGPVGYASLNGGTTGGAGGSETTVTSIDELLAAVEGDEPAIIYIDSVLSGSSEKIRVGSNKSILGRSSKAGIEGAGLFIKEAKNVIVRNLAISKVNTGEKDAIGVQKSENVWIDHCDLSSDLDHGKDYYDGLADFTHGSDYITVSNTKFHDHYKASLCGHTDSNADEDAGKLHVTYANNHWANINSRMPLVRFGTVHVFNGYYEGGSMGDSAVNTRMGAQVLVESNAMAGIKDAVVSEYSDEDGYAVVRGNDFGEGASTAPEGTLTSVPYEYELLGSENVEAAVVGVAGNTLTL